jgi:hypothetical protein
MPAKHANDTKLFLTIKGEFLSLRFVFLGDQPQSEAGDGLPPQELSLGDRRSVGRL